MKTPKTTGRDPELLRAALQGFTRQREALDIRIGELESELSGLPAARVTEDSSNPKPVRRRLSVAARKRISAAQKKRWAEYNKQKGN